MYKIAKKDDGSFSDRFREYSKSNPGAAGLLSGGAVGAVFGAVPEIDRVFRSRAQSYASEKLGPAKAEALDRIMKERGIGPIELHLGPASDVSERAAREEKDRALRKALEDADKEAAGKVGRLPKRLPGIPTAYELRGIGRAALKKGLMYGVPTALAAEYFAG